MSGGEIAYIHTTGAQRPNVSTRGDQKVLQLGYKTLTHYITHAVIFLYILMQHCNICNSAYFQLLLSAVYALKIEFSVLTLRPFLYSDLSDSSIINQVPRR